MIIAKSLKSCLRFLPNLPHPTPIFALPHLNFSTTKPPSLTSQQSLTIFQSLLQQNTDHSLQKAAQLLATLELQVQNNYQKIRDIENVLQKCSAPVRDLIQKIQIVMDNVKQQQEEIEAIDKRAEKQIADCKNFSVSSIAREVLQISDSLTRCKKQTSTPTPTPTTPQNTQVQLSLQKADKQLKLIFERYGIKQFDPTGQQYDPNKEQALAVIPAPNQKVKGKIAYTTRTGFFIKGRLLRSAHVGIYQ